MAERQTFIIKMVRVCAFPGCEKKMQSWTPEMFHRLPFRLERDIFNECLIVLQVDINMPIEILRGTDYRVCSDHFDPDDFTMPKNRVYQKSFF